MHIQEQYSLVCRQLSRRHFFSEEFSQCLRAHEMLTSSELWSWETQMCHPRSPHNSVEASQIFHINLFLQKKQFCIEHILVPLWPEKTLPRP